MSDFTYTDRTNPFDSIVGGGTDTSSVSPNFAKGLITLDKIAYAGRMQMIASQNRRPWVSWSDVRPDAPYLFQDNNWRCLAEHYYYLPEVLPGSNNKTTSTGTSVADRGFLSIALMGRDFSASAQIDVISLAGSYGQSSTVSLTNLSAALNSTGSEKVEYLDDSAGTSNVVLFPVGTAGGDLVRITLWAGTGVFDGRGYVQTWAIGEPYLPSTEP